MMMVVSLSNIITTSSQTIMAYRDSLHSIGYYLKKSNNYQNGWETDSMRVERQKALVEQTVMYYLENNAIPKNVLDKNSYKVKMTSKSFSDEQITKGVYNE